MAWITTDEGRHVNTEWFNDDERKKYAQIEKNQKEAFEQKLFEKYKNINPNFKKDASHLDPEGYNNNCVMCALAFEANMRGEDVEAKPFKFGYLVM